MGFSSTALVFFVVMVAALNVSSSMAATYDVGDASGWTTIGHIDYNKWSSSKTIHVGDTVRFAYDPKLHNVLQVTSSDYESCTTTSPLATYSTGNDSIVISEEDNYFICGVSSHCKMGQKVNIQVSTSIGHAETKTSCYSDPCSTPSTPSTPSIPRTPSPPFNPIPPSPPSMIYTPPTFTPPTYMPPPTTSSASNFRSRGVFVGVAVATVLIFAH